MCPDTVSGVESRLSDLESCLAPSPRALLPAGHAPLSATQLGERVSQPAWVLNQRAVRQGQETLQANVEPDLSRFTRGDLGFGQLKLETDVPFAEAAPDNDGLDLSVVGDRAVIGDLDLADVLHVEQGASPVVKSQLAAVAIGEREAVEAVASLESRVSGLLSSLDSAQEGREPVRPCPRSSRGGCSIT